MATAEQFRTAATTVAVALDEVRRIRRRLAERDSELGFSGDCDVARVSQRAVRATLDNTATLCTRLEELHTTYTTRATHSAAYSAAYWVWRGRRDQWNDDQRAFENGRGPDPGPRPRRPGKRYPYVEHSPTPRWS